MSFNPDFPWRPAFAWDNCPACFENFSMEPCDNCGGGHEHKPFDRVDLEQAMESAIRLNEYNVMFVAVPVFNQVELKKLREQSLKRLEQRAGISSQGERNAL